MHRELAFILGVKNQQIDLVILNESFVVVEMVAQHNDAFYMNIHACFSKARAARFNIVARFFKELLGQCFSCGVGIEPFERPLGRYIPFHRLGVFRTIFVFRGLLT